MMMYITTIWHFYVTNAISPLRFFGISFFMPVEYHALAKADYERQKLRQKMPPYPNQTLDEMREMLKKLRPNSKKAIQILKQIAMYEDDKV
jgi:hypothetical protein